MCMCILYTLHMTSLGFAAHVHYVGMTSALFALHVAKLGCMTETCDLNYGAQLTKSPICTTQYSGMQLN